jgi:hypothetical protein
MLLSSYSIIFTEKAMTDDKKIIIEKGDLFIIML